MDSVDSQSQPEAGVRVRVQCSTRIGGPSVEFQYARYWWRSWQVAVALEYFSLKAEMHELPGL